MDAFRLLQVLVNELGHLEHGDLSFAAKNCFQCIVGIDHALVFAVLKTVLLDVSPDFLNNVGTRHRT